jgi:predicted ArsR family transcriptional regulator
MVDAWKVAGQDVPDLPLWRQARRADPVTSKIAARMAGGLRTDHQRRILDSLGQGPAGASEIAERCGLTAHQVNKRLTELGRHGLIVTTGRTVRSAAGRPEREWRVAVGI